MDLRNFFVPGGSARRAILLTLTIGLLGFTAGCSDDDDDTGTGPGTTTQYRDFTLNASGLDANLTQQMFVRVVSDQNDSVVATAIVNPITAGDAEVVMPRALVVGHDYRAEMFIDVNGNGLYDAPPIDQAWSVDVPTNGTVSFTHNTNFTDIGATPNMPGQPLVVNLSGMTPSLLGFMEMRVIEDNTNRTVGLYRQIGPIAPTMNVTIPGVVEAGTDYHVDFFTDVNQNQEYDAPPTDYAWRLEGTGGTTGLTFNFTTNTDYTDVAF